MQEVRRTTRNASSVDSRNVRRLATGAIGPAEKAESPIDSDVRLPTQFNAAGEGDDNEAEQRPNAHTGGMELARPFIASKAGSHSLVEPVSEGEDGRVGHGGIPPGNHHGPHFTPRVKMRSKRRLPQ